MRENQKRFGEPRGLPGGAKRGPGHAPSARPAQVIVDDRERNSGIVELLRKTEDIEVSLQRLALGDYLWDERLLFERKTLKDLITSLKDGRALRQACQLASSPLNTVLILEGTGPVSSDMKREAIQGALITITLRLGIPLLRSTGPEETVRLMLYSARQIRYTQARTTPRYRSTKQPTRKRRVQLEILQGLPGIGPHRAQQLIHTFGSIEAVVNASVAELRGASGVGREIAETIRWSVSEASLKYG